ncbi:hypothetical protein [Halolamina sp. C58]|uniref:hypothetical protein n=1 Tax=Halolamina sp. C58 TaxID=3421640 RepID=UPI003EC0E5C3
MVAVEQVLFGVFLAVGGVLLAIDHPAIDWLNRWLKSAGTTQQPSEIEMDDNARLVGFVVGSLTVVVGLLLVVDGIA